MTEPDQIDETPEQSAAQEPEDMLIPLGAQGRIGAARIGVMTATQRETGVVARLQIREDDGEAAKVVLSPGEEFSLFSAGRAVLVDVLLDTGSKGKRAVVIRKLPD